MIEKSEITNEKKRENYKKKLRQYIQGTNSIFGIYLIFKVRDMPSHNKNYFKNLIEDHSDIENLNVQIIDCTEIISN